jgi:hypothetical protein
MIKLPGNFYSRKALFPASFQEGKAPALVGELFLFSTELNLPVLIRNSFLHHARICAGKTIQGIGPGQIVKINA